MPFFSSKVGIRNPTWEEGSAPCSPSLPNFFLLPPSFSLSLLKLALDQLQGSPKLTPIEVQTTDNGLEAALPRVLCIATLVTLPKSVRSQSSATRTLGDPLRPFQALPQTFVVSILTGPLGKLLFILFHISPVFEASEFT